MSQFSDAARSAIAMVVDADPALVEIVVLSLQVSLSAVIIAAVIGLPLGAWIALHRFPGHGVVIGLLNSLMGLPPVVLGLMVYLLLSRAGPLGEYGLLFTPEAMVLAQTLLVLPIIAALARQTISDLYLEYREQFRSLRIGPGTGALVLIREGRYSLATALLAGFGRASAEVGAVMIVGGNINHVTRVMTTTIAMETSKGDFSLALGLGFVLLSIVILVNMFVLLLQATEKRA
jgi:tungstate transport system permease protein